MISQAIYTLLSTDSNITNIVGTKIFPIRATQGQEPPFLIYIATGNDPEATKQAASHLDTYTLQIATYSKTHMQNETLHTHIRTRLDRYSGGTIQTINFIGDNAGFVDAAQIYQYESIYEIKQIRS